MGNNRKANLLAQLERAATVVPPDDAMARTALTGIAGILPEVGGDKRIQLLQQTAALTGQMAVAVMAHREKYARGEATILADEFNTHSLTYGAVAEALCTTENVQIAPTQTSGKSQSGGKS